MSKKNGRRLDALPRVERLRLGAALARARWRFWWRSPGDSAMHPLPKTVNDLLAQLQKSGGRRHIEDFGARVFPYADDSELLRIESPDAEAAEWVRTLLSKARANHTFGYSHGLAVWLGEVAKDLLCQPEVVARVFWDEQRWREKGWARASPFYVHVLDPEGVEYRGDGTYLIRPTQAHPGMRPRGSTDDPYVLPTDETLVFKSSTLASGRLPLLEAAPHYAAYRVADQESNADFYAQTAPEDRDLRAQLARLKSGRWQEPKRLANSRLAQTLGSSLLEHDVYGNIYASTTEYYQAWQHREALRIAAAVRGELLATAVSDLITPALLRVGLGNEEVSMEPRGAPNVSEIDRAFEAFLRGETDLWGFHDKAHWFTESERRLQRHIERGVDLY